MLLYIGNSLKNFVAWQNYDNGNVLHLTFFVSTMLPKRSRVQSQKSKNDGVTLIV